MSRPVFEGGGLTWRTLAVVMMIGAALWTALGVGIGLILRWLRTLPW